MPLLALITSAATLIDPVVASIPSPPRNSFNIGPLEIHVYGLAIAIGIIAAVVVVRGRYAAYGGDPDLVDQVALWAVIAGVVGARLAHVSTNLDIYLDDPLRVFAVWRGGLAFFGGILLGAIVGVWMMRRSHGDVRAFMDAGAVGIPLAQAVGRLGNYFNQELFGLPTDLPWGLEIDPENRPARFAEHETFHPTFLYEQLWNLTIIAVLIAIDRRRILPRGALFVVYLVMYGVGRFLLELIRIDTEFRFLGLSRNGWVALSAALIGTVVLVLWTRREGPREPVPSEGGAPADDAS